MRRRRRLYPPRRQRELRSGTDFALLCSLDRACRVLLLDFEALLEPRQRERVEDLLERVQRGMRALVSSYALSPTVIRPEDAWVLVVIVWALGDAIWDRCQRGHTGKFRGCRTCRLEVAKLDGLEDVLDLAASLLEERACRGAVNGPSARGSRQ